MKLKTLSVFTSILFVLSLVVYSSENRRGIDLVTGSDYIKGLDLNKIQKITLSFKGSKKIDLTRDSNRFVLENYKSYPTLTSKVNDLIYKIASIQVKEKAEDKASEKDLEKYELTDKKRKFKVEIFDNQGKKTVAFSVGKSYKGKGNYLYREGKEEVYLSKENLWINSSYKDFINMVLLDIKNDDIKKISLNTDKEIKITKNEDKFVLEAPKAKKFKEDKVKEFASNLKSIKFDDFYKITEPKIQALNFDKNLKIELNNNLIYKVSLAQEKNEHFIKLAAILDETPTQFVVKKTDGKEELQKIEDVIKAQGEAQRVNLEKGTWVYKVNKSVYEKLAKDSKFFL